ncbi:hypothetical protein SAMN05216275_104114 [Streptosporangium canum]|uniref:Uncharacterized protein n=1 Tax=Streptosporangium canum TaxID=324952 RepID=A0A1I3JS37_9ACTN|nr:hypothetical protein SAMN05216275_104114 [Streptosporangium canum]
MDEARGHGRGLEAEAAPGRVCGLRADGVEGS